MTVPLDVRFRRCACGEYLGPTTPDGKTCRVCARKNGWPEPTAEERACAICQRPFIPRHSTHLYCSARCAMQRATRPPAAIGIQNCETCGRLYPATREGQRYCSRRCLDREKARERRGKGEEKLSIEELKARAEELGQKLAQAQQQAQAHRQQAAAWEREAIKLEGRLEEVQEQIDVAEPVLEAET